MIGDDLDPAVYAALTRIAEGRGRTPTYAHPDCICGTVIRTTCWRCGANPDTDCHHGRGATIARHRDCPIHNQPTGRNQS